VFSVFKDYPLLDKALARSLVCCVAALFVLPFLWSKHTLPIPSFYNECIAAMLLLVASLVSVIFFSRREYTSDGYSLPLISLLFIPLIAVLGVQVGLNKLAFSYNALFPALVMAIAVASVMLGATTIKLFGSEKLLFWICIACIIGGVLNVAAQIIQLSGAGTYFQPWVSQAKDSYYGNLAQRNHLATYLSWALIAALYLHAKNHIRRYAIVLLGLVLLVGIALTASRMTWLQVGWVALGGGYLISRIESASRPRFWYLVFFLPLVYLVVTFLLPHIFDLLSLNLGKTAIERIQTEALDRNRWLIYSQAWEIFRMHPFLGIGPGELSFNQFLLMDHYDKTLFASSAHNLVLDLLVMTGVVGTFFFMWFFIAWFLRIRKVAVSLETVCIMLMLAMLGIHSLLEFPEWYGFFLFPTAFLIGCLETRFIGIKKGIFVRITPIVAVSYGIAFNVILCLQYIQLEKLYSTMYFYNPNAEPATEKGLILIENYRATTFFKAPAEFLLSWTFRLNDIALDTKLTISERAMRYQPEANIVYRHIVLLALAGQQEKAIFYLKRLKKTYPSEFNNIGKALNAMAVKQPSIFGPLANEAANEDDHR
jgi:O-antigen ligase